jgi:hypothetical protein
MTRAEFCAELMGIQMLLREHQYLQYTPSGRKEYEQKVRTCAAQFAYLVFRKTGVPVKPWPGTVPIESARDPSYQAGRDLAARSAKRCRALAKTAYESQRGDILECAALWEKACDRLAEPDPR